MAARWQALCHAKEHLSLAVKGGLWGEHGLAASPRDFLRESDGGHQRQKRRGSQDRNLTFDESRHSSSREPNQPLCPSSGMAAIRVGWAGGTTTI